MNIIITKNFEKSFTKIFKKNIDMLSFSYKLKKQTFLNLEEPYEKFKFKMGGIAIRGIMMKHDDKISVLPLMIVKKTNKQYGMNLSVTPQLKIILHRRYDKAQIDIENDDFTIY